MDHVLDRKEFRSAVMRGIVLPLILFGMWATVALAQGTTVPQGTDHPGGACPPSAGRDAPTVGKRDGKTLSEQLAQSKGVICPPAGIDLEMRQAPPEGGTLRVLPPPGPTQNPSAQPK
jgi:hypothetical protein